MNAVEDLKGFWSSLITEKGIVPHIESLMNIADAEERGLSLMSRVFFLWCMGLKYEREDLQHKIRQIQNIINKQSDYSSCSKCYDISSILNKPNHPNKDEETLKKLDDSCDKNIYTSKRKHLESSPEQAKKKRKENEENIDCSPEQITPFKILAPETQAFTQKFGGDEGHVLLIPETIPDDEFRYGNTDFFQMSPEVISDISPEPKLRRSPRKSPNMKSPVLGKLNKALTPVQVKPKLSLLHHQSPEHDLKSSSPEEKNTDKSSLLRTPDSLTSSPSLLACNRILTLRSPTKKATSLSPPNKKTINQLSIKSDSIKSDSINFKLPSIQNKSPLSSHSSKLSDVSNTRKLMLKTRSEVGNTIANRSKLSRIKTLTALHSSRPSFEVSLDSSVKKKNYKQTKITQDSFSKNTNVAKLTGGKCSAVKIPLAAEDDEMAKAIEESLHSKVIEDMLRKKQKELEKESPRQLKKCMSQIKKEQSSSENSLRKSPRAKDQKSVNMAGTSGGSLLLSVEEVLAKLENVPEFKTEEEKEKQKEIEEKPKENKEEIEEKPKEKHEEMEEKPTRLRRNRKKAILQDSFDMLPAEKEPDFAYKGDVARKKQDKKKLDGWDCHECRNYYEAKGVSSTERKELQNKCSRHRSKHRPVTNTPEGFWVLGWSDDEAT